MNNAWKRKKKSSAQSCALSVEVKSNCWYAHCKSVLCGLTALWICVYACVFVPVIVETCCTRSGLTLINQCRVLFRDMASSLPVKPLYLSESPGEDSTHEHHQSWLLLSAKSSQEPLQFPFSPLFILLVFWLSFWTQHPALLPSAVTFTHSFMMNS